MFWIRYTDNSGTHEVSLTPGPTEGDYPEGDGSKVQTTQDGAIVIQRPMRDSRPRKWLWRGYGRSDASNNSLWDLLQSLTTKARVAAGLSATVKVWEDVTGAGGFDKTDGLGAKVYTTVRVHQATRKPSPSGPVVYETALTFYVDDLNYSA